MQNLREDSILVLSRSDYRSMPWKNGKGTTQEIAISPPDASLETGFAWRLSSAALVEGAEFSKFPGYDRYLILLSGKNLVLRFKESDHEVCLEEHEVCLFSGEKTVGCEAVTGESTDLNLIFRRGEVKVALELIRFSERARSFRVEGRTAFIFAIGGPISATLYPGEAKRALQEGETLRLNVSELNRDEDLLIQLEPGNANSMVALIEISEIPVA